MLVNYPGGTNVRKTCGLCELLIVPDRRCGRRRMTRRNRTRIRRQQDISRRKVSMRKCRHVVVIVADDAVLPERPWVVMIGGCNVWAAPQRLLVNAKFPGNGRRSGSICKAGGERVQ
jgi:hypothetical protein